MAETRSVRVSTDDIGRRLDNFLFSALSRVPKSRVYQMIRRGEVRVNGRRANQKYRLLAGDVVRIPPIFANHDEDPLRLNIGALKSIIQESVLFEDQSLLILNKPAGIPVHGGSSHRFGVIEILRALQGSELALAHRLDRDTSGCLVIAKNGTLLRKIHAALREGKVEKEYQGLVKGVWLGGARSIQGALKKGLLRGGERVMHAFADGKVASTWMCPMQRFSAATLMRIKPFTGRTHQIRVHAASEGYPLAGDLKYGEHAFNRQMRVLGLRRLFLHATRLRFSLANPSVSYRFDAPLPSELKRFLEQLQNNK